jgi:ubiquinone/menaquinone biosynthesis C-methylase UbiE
LGPFAKQRKKIIPLATGNVLEIGIGTGLNLPLYDNKRVIRLTAIDPSEDTWKKCTIDTKARIYFKFMILLQKNCRLMMVDTVVVTYSFALSLMQKKALEEMRRVKPTGLLFFCEHGILQKKEFKRYKT